jgi:hypothetical protein
MHNKPVAARNSVIVCETNAGLVYHLRLFIADHSSAALLCKSRTVAIRNIQVVKPPSSPEAARAANSQWRGKTRLICPKCIEAWEQRVQSDQGVKT